MPHPGSELSVDSVSSAADRKDFILLPHRLYREDPHWVAPLNKDVKKFLDPRRRHPFYESGDIAFFLCRRHGEVVGRIATIENRAHNTCHDERIGFFGFFEAENDDAVVDALFTHAETWARARWLLAPRGPASPSFNYETGLLVHGEPGPPVVMMPYNPPWYATQVERAGYGKVMDLLAYYLSEDIVDTERWGRFAERIQTRTGAVARPLDMKRFDQEVRLIIDLFNDAWSDNWGFVPMNEAEIDAMARELRPVVLPHLCSFVMKDEKEAGFFLALPDYNRVLIHLKGRLFPFGFLRLLRSRRRLRSCRVLLMGVRKEHQRAGLDVAINAEIVRTCLSEGIREAESSWILETNKPMINTLERVGSRHYRTYRVYEKPL